MIFVTFYFILFTKYYFNVNKYSVKGKTHILICMNLNNCNNGQSYFFLIDTLCYIIDIQYILYIIIYKHNISLSVFCLSAGPWHPIPPFIPVFRPSFSYYYIIPPLVHLASVSVIYLSVSFPPSFLP